MKPQKDSFGLKATTAATFVLMVAVNGMANVLPINKLQTGQVSDSYPNLFAPAGATFAIWGLIYLLLAMYTLYQFGLFREKEGSRAGYSENRVQRIFGLSSLFNTAWIFAWHYQLIPVSLLLIAGILVCLILINLELARASLSGREKVFVRLPFSVYFGWITVATIANATTLLVDLGWDGFGLSEPVWTVIILLVGMLIGVATMVRNRSIAYGLVLIWAYGGIWLKHTSASGFSGRYSQVIATTLVCIAIYAAAEGYLLFNARKTARQ
jgi:hypothetical protein